MLLQKLYYNIERIYMERIYIEIYSMERFQIENSSSFFGSLCKGISFELDVQGTSDD